MLSRYCFMVGFVVIEVSLMAFLLRPAFVGRSRPLNEREVSGSTCSRSREATGPASWPESHHLSVRVSSGDGAILAYVFSAPHGGAYHRCACPRRFRISACRCSP